MVCLVEERKVDAGWSREDAHVELGRGRKTCCSLRSVSRRGLVWLRSVWGDHLGLPVVRARGRQHSQGRGGCLGKDRRDGSYIPLSVYASDG